MTVTSFKFLEGPLPAADPPPILADVVIQAHNLLPRQPLPSLVIPSPPPIQAHNLLPRQPLPTSRTWYLSGGPRDLGHDHYTVGLPVRH